MLWIALALALTSSPAGTAADKGDTPSPQMKALLQNCDAHKFETMIDVTINGITKKSRVKLCGTEDQTDADWIATLKDAVAKTSANPKMPPSVRNQIVSAINAEIARLTGAGPALVSSRSSALAGVAALPPLPQNSPAPLLPQPRTIVRTEPSEAYSSLPPLPTTPPPPVHVLAGASGESLPLLPRPKMSFSCFTPGDIGDGPCTEFARETLVTVRADEDLPAGTSLRFVRSGETRADLELAQLKRGKSERFALPEQVCRGAAGGKLEIRIVRSLPAAGPDGEEVGSDGPYVLRC